MYDVIVVGAFPAEVYQLRAALRGNQEATNRFFMARQGMVPRETFFNPENLQRIRRAAVSPPLPPFGA